MTGNMADGYAALLEQHICLNCLMATDLWRRLGYRCAPACIGWRRPGTKRRLARVQRQHIGDRLSGVLLRQGVIAFREQPAIETFLYFTNPCHMECMEYPSFNARPVVQGHRIIPALGSLSFKYISLCIVAESKRSS